MVNSKGKKEKRSRTINLLSTYGDKTYFLCLGFVLAVLWWDLAFDSAVLKATGPADLAPVVAYYKRIITDSSPMIYLVWVVAALLTYVIVVRMFEVLKQKDLQTEDRDIQFGVHPLQIAQTIIALTFGGAFVVVLPLAKRVGAGEFEDGELIDKVYFLFYAHSYYFGAAVVSLIIEYIIASSTAQLDSQADWELIKRE